MAAKRSPKAGFTVVETMFVLAIAGLILMIVLMAIPTLTRNSRNNQRKQDVQTILQTISRWELNNSGGFPSTLRLDNFLAQYEKLTYYTPPAGNVSIITSTYAIDTVSITTNPTGSSNDTVVIYNHSKCIQDHPGDATNAGAGFNDVVALYSIETGGGTSPKCQQL